MLSACSPAAKVVTPRAKPLGAASLFVFPSSAIVVLCPLTDFFALLNGRSFPA